MRPRVFPAEDKFDYSEFPQVYNASMRPRVFPAEDIPSLDRTMRAMQSLQ